MTVVAQTKPNMDEFVFWRAYRSHTLSPMSEAPTDGSVILAAFPDDQADNNEKVRMMRVRFNRASHFWCNDRRWIDDDDEGPGHAEEDFEGWIEP